jgi:hypothetical protein
VQQGWAEATEDVERQLRLAKAKYLAKKSALESQKSFYRQHLAELRQEVRDLAEEGARAAGERDAMRRMNARMLRETAEHMVSFHLFSIFHRRACGVTVFPNPMFLLL